MNTKFTFYIVFAHAVCQWKHTRHNNAWVYNMACYYNYRSTKKPVTTMLTYPWKCTVLHCNHLGNTWKPLVLMTRHFDYCPSASEGDNQSVRSSAPVVSRCFPGGYNVKLYISRGRLAWWLLAFLHSVYYLAMGNVTPRPTHTHNLTYTHTEVIRCYSSSYKVTTLIIKHHNHTMKCHNKNITSQDEVITFT